MKAYMSNPNVERAADWPAHAFAQPTAARMAEREAKHILAETEQTTDGARVSLYSLARTKSGRAFSDSEARYAITSALSVFVADGVQACRIIYLTKESAAPRLCLGGKK